MDEDEFDFRLRQLTRIDRILEELSSVEEHEVATLVAYSEAIEDAFLATRAAREALHRLPRNGDARGSDRERI